MASEGFSISVASVVEDVIKQHGTRLSDIDLASRKAQEAAARRYEAASWLRRTVGVVGARDLPEEPSEEEFRVGVRNGMILCNALNKVIPGVVPKVVEIPADSNAPSDGTAAISAYQYFENVRNFVVVMEDMGLPTFEASDIQEGGKGSRVVNSVLALKSYAERRDGSSKCGGILKPTTGKYFMRKNSEPFMNSLSKTQSGFSVEQNFSADFSIESTDMTTSHSLNMLVSAALSNKKPEEVPILVESMLSKVMQEFERRLASQKELVKTTLKDLSDRNKCFSELSVSTGLSPSIPAKMDMEVKENSKSSREDDSSTISNIEDNSFSRIENACTTSKKEDTSTTSIEEEKEDTSTTSIEEDSSAVSRDNTESMQKEEDLRKKLEKQLNTESMQKEEDLRKKLEKQLNTESMQKEEDLRKKLEKQLNTESMQKEEDLRKKLEKQLLMVGHQQREIQELKHTLNTTRAGLTSMKTQYSEEFRSLGKHFKVLSHAASGYHKILEENRKLYNQVQDLKGNIRVYCRVRPFLPGQASGTTSIGHMDDGNITIVTPSKNGKEARKSFTFNKVFGPSASQGEVFSDTQPLIRSVLDGYNVCIFAYGQTGSGKTFTMTGPNEFNEETLGVNYRALNDLFSLSEQRRDACSYEISVQMMEIYNEQVRDLLVRDGQHKKLEVRNNSQKGPSVPDANMVPVSSTSDVIELMNLGHRNRAVCSTAMNDRSSRSHSCLTVHVQGRVITSGSILRGCMHLVDLAGSERVDKSEVKGDRLKEAVHINKSLSALGDVIAALAQKNSHVPYRNSKLTQLLQDSLGGQAKTLMFVHISPEVDATAETLGTLKFAERVATIELGAARSNKESPEVKELKEQIATLKSALARKGGDNVHIHSTMSSPDIFRTSSSGLLSPDHDVVGCLVDSRQPMEDVGNIQARNDFAYMQKKPSYDFQELSSAADSSPSLDSSPKPTFQKGDERDIGSGNWVDKIMVNKNEAISGDDDSLREWDGDSLTAPGFFYQQYNRKAPSSVTTDDSDDLEIATSDSSEADLLWQGNQSKIPSVYNGGGSGIKKPQSRPVKSQDARAPSRSQIPSPARKTSSGYGQTRTGRPSGPEAKRKN